MISVKKLLNHWLVGIFLLLIVFQTASATFHFFEIDSCREIKISCQEHQHYTEAQEICKVCTHLCLLQNYYEVPVNTTTPAALAVNKPIQQFFIPEWPLLEPQSSYPLRGPPAFS